MLKTILTLGIGFILGVAVETIAIVLVNDWRR